MRREVWSAHEATITIWEEDASGNVIEPAIRECSFVQDASARPIRRNRVLQEPGVAYEQPRSVVVGHEISIGEFFQRQSEQTEPFLETDVKYRIRIEFVNERYTDVAPLENDVLEYSGVVVTDGPEEAWQDDDIVASRVVFTAQELI